MVNLKYDKRNKLGKRIGSVFMTMVLTISSMILLDEPLSVKAGDPVYQIMTIASGFNADVFYDNGENIGDTDSCESSSKVSDSKACFYTETANTTNLSTGGFPADGKIVDESNSSLSWQLAGYKENNALRLAPGDDGMLTFSTIGCYQKLYFLVNAGGVGSSSSATMNVTVTYSDGTTSNQTFEVVDWYNSSNSVTAKYQRTYNKYYIYPDGSTFGGPYLTKCEMDIDTTKLISNIKISNSISNAGVYVCVYGVSGLTSSIDAPVLNAATNVTHTGFNASWNSVDEATSYRFDLATDANFTHMVSGYNNKEVNGPSIDVTGLTSDNNIYYYRVRSVNSQGGQSVSSNVQSVSPHIWEYSVTGTDTITAACTAVDCSNSIDLTLLTEEAYYTSQLYSGAGFDATELSIFNGYTGNTVSTSDIVYYMDSDLTQKTTTQNSGAASVGGAPKNNGTYYASLTVEGKTAKKMFKISKATQNAVVNMSGYSFSEDETAQLPTPMVSGAQESPEITYYYNTTESTEGAKEWKDIKADTLLPGTYYMYAVLGDTTNYNGGTTDFTEFVVSKGNMTDIDAEPVVKIYDGIATGITLTGVPEGATVKYGLSEDACDLEESPTIKDVTESPCTVYYTVEKSGYETVSGQATITISPKTAELAWSGDSFVYDGKTHSPSVVVNNLVENDVCVVTVSGGKKDAGDAYVAQAVELSNSNYVLPEITTKTFSITQRTLGLEWQDETTFKYNSLEQGVIATPLNVVEGDSVTLTYTDNKKKDVGTYTAKVTGVDNANYALPENVEQTYKIEKQAMNDSESQISISVDKDGNTKVYCETDEERIELVEDVDYTVEKTEDGYIKIIGIGGYESEIKVKQPEASGDGRIVTTVVVETEVEEIQPFLAPVTDTNAKNTLLNVIKSDAVKERVVAGENVDYDATLYLKLLDAAATASDDEKTLISEQIKKNSSIPSDAKVGMYLDLTLYMSYSVSDSSGLLESGTDKIKDTSDEKMGTGNGYNQKITITIPEELRNTNEKIKRKYYVIRVHEDENGVKTAELIASIQEGYNLTFETDKFSIYAVAYSDESIPENGNINNGNTKVEAPNNSIIKAPGNANTANKQASNSSTANTADSAKPFMVITIMVIAFAMLVILSLKRKNKFM